MKNKMNKKEAIGYFLVAITAGIAEILVYHLFHIIYSIKISNLIAYIFGATIMFVLLKKNVYKSHEKNSIKQIVLTIIMHFCAFNAQCFLLELFEGLFSDTTIVLLQMPLFVKTIVNVTLYPFVWIGNRLILKGCSVLFTEKTLLFHSPFKDVKRYIFIHFNKKSIFFNILNIFFIFIFLFFIKNLLKI